MRISVVALGLVATVAVGCGEQKDPGLASGAGMSGAFAGAGGSGAVGAAGTAGSAGGVGTAGTAGSAGGAGTAGAAGVGGAGATGVDPGTAGDPGCDGPLLPMAVGNSWTYQVTDVDGITSTKRTVVEDMQPVGGSGPNAGKTAFHVVTTKVSGGASDKTESWQDVLSDGTIVRYRELSYPAGGSTPNGEDFWDPSKLRIDNSAEHTAQGATWVDRYMETKTSGGTTSPAEPRQDEWAVVAVDVPCGPVAGTMLSCIRLSKTATAAAGGSKTYLFAPCVGKVREEGTQTEVLISFTVN